LSLLELSLWPEFDRPEVLVIYRGVFAAETTLPVPVEIRIPVVAGPPTAVAYVDPEGQRLNQSFTTAEEDEWLVVVFDLPSLAFQLEYYAPLPEDAGLRTFEYTYAADYAIDRLSLEFQVPPTANGFELETRDGTGAATVVQEADGLTYHVVETGPLARGDVERWAFSYAKPNSELTVAAFTAPEAEASDVLPGGSDLGLAAEGRGGTTVLTFALAFVALVAVGAGAFWLGKQTSEPAAEQVRRPKRRGGGRGAAAPRPRARAAFCHVCGTGLRSDAEFCHRCGAEVRVE
jgi:hypothetical protein